ncbi:glycosyltransferase [Candidatus Omnitrophota bacterium]
MKIALIYNKSGGFSPITSFDEVIKNAGIHVEHFWTKDAHAIPKKFDLYFRIDHGDYKYDLPDSLRPAVFYAIDTHLKKPYKKIRKQAGHYDVVFCAQASGARMLTRELKIDCQWVPLAFDQRYIRKIDTPKKFDLGFVGRNAKKFSRGRHLKLLKKKYPQSSIGEAPFDRMSAIYSASKIGFNSSLNNDINLRIFEVMACGSFLLTSRIKDGSLERLFTNGKHLVIYRNDRQLLELVEYYLGHAAEREAIARAGYELVISRHSFYHRVQTMLNYIAFTFGGEYNALRI